MDVSKKPIKTFLDSVDKVLNSNTFLLSLEVNNSHLFAIQTSMIEFIKSGELKNQMLEQDLLRFRNYARKIERVGEVGELIKADFEIHVEAIADDYKKEYLISLLTATNKLRFFQSPYRKQLEEKEAKEITESFLEAILENQNWKFYALNTDFCYSRDEERQLYREGKIVMSYFYDLFGDSMSLIVREDGQAFLLMTNGSD